ncbi:hypothetical protein N9L68_08650 [bacterium]|nr:hypothetical protein [bacterium]
MFNRKNPAPPDGCGGPSPSPPPAPDQKAQRVMIGNRKKTPGIAKNLPGQIPVPVQHKGQVITNRTNPLFENKHPPRPRAKARSRSTTVIGSMEEGHPTNKRAAANSENAF